ncbi:MAG: type II secretion system protein [Acidobacteriota bacterium]
MRTRGFTLLEMLVATTIMGIAVVALLANLSTSMRTAARLTEHDRAALVAKRKMDELLIDPRLPKLTDFGGELGRGGWRARVTPFEMLPGAGPGAPVLERVELEIWWLAGERRRTLQLEAFRRGVLGGGP